MGTGPNAGGVQRSVTTLPAIWLATTPVGGCTVSSSRMVPTPWASPITAFTAPDRFTVNVSAGSGCVSPLTVMFTVCVVVPGANVSWPLAGMKSLLLVNVKISDTLCTLPLSPAASSDRNRFHVPFGSVPLNTLSGDV